MSFRAPMETKPPEVEAAAHADDARRELMQASRHADRAGQRQVWCHLMAAVDAVDDARSLLAEKAAAKDE